MDGGRWTESATASVLGPPSSVHLLTDSEIFGWARPEVRIAVADENGYDGAGLHALERTPAVQQEYQSFSEEAVRLGVFGAPTFIVRGHNERWWGQDRLFFVDRFLDRLRG